MSIDNKEINTKPSEYYILGGDWEKQSKVLIERHPTLTSKDLQFENW